MGVCETRTNENNTNHATKIPLNILNQISKSICKITYKKWRIYSRNWIFYEYK